MGNHDQITATQIIELLTDARSRTLALVADLDDQQMIGPLLSIVNPLLWEIGHVAWFQERWALRHLRGQEPLKEGIDALYDSAAVAHDTRWDLPLPSREQTLAYMQDGLEAVINRLGADPLSAEEVYFHLLPILHEDMHSEAITYTRQTLSYPPPKVNKDSEAVTDDSGGVLPGDAELPGGTFVLGATPDYPFVFDNEKWAHPVEVRPFRIARAAVTNREFAAFVDDRGYMEDRWWSEAGRAWRARARADRPLYWEPASGGRWLCRLFNEYLPLRDHLPVIHVNWYEAEAYCNWAGRRLPTEAEWEMAASTEPVNDSHNKRVFPWGDEPPGAERANLDWRAGGCIEVGALPEGESACGCRQMIGNVWEWTATDFGPYPGFIVDPYKEYSVPWFGDHKILRGGCWATRSRLIRNTWRNFYKPDRRDVWAGLRTCARD